jgi:DNA-binding transcriptional MerR regulator
MEKTEEYPERYLTPKEIMLETGVGVETLRRYRREGVLKKIKWSIGGGKPYYEINEVKKLFHKN